jgi:sec-independent protein translocase protein TatC
MITIRKYIHEIKYRMFFIAISWFSNIYLSYYYVNTLIYIIIKPGLTLYKNNELYFVYTHLNEIFNSYISLVFMCANSITMIIMTYNLLVFFKPGMYIEEYCNVKKLFIKFNLLWIYTIISMYYIMLPFSWTFFLSYQSTSFFEKNTQIFFEAKIQEYVSFIYELYYICLTINIFIYILVYTIQKYKLSKKYIYLIIFTFSTIITPPDVYSQIMTSCFLIVILELYTYITILTKYSLRKPIKAY